MFNIFFTGEKHVETVEENITLVKDNYLLKQEIIYLKDENIGLKKEIEQQNVQPIEEIKTDSIPTVEPESDSIVDFSFSFPEGEVSDFENQ